LIKGISLKTRHTFWSLIVLALLIGGGGFFCYHSQQQRLHEILDAELLSTARDFDCLFSESDAPLSAQNQNDYCRSFSQLPLRREGELAAALYSAQGKLICSNHHPLSQILVLSPAIKKTLVSKPQFTTATDEKGQPVRILTVPIVRQGRTVLQLQLGSSLLPIQKQTEQFALILVAIVIVMLLCYGIVQWLLLGQLAGQLAAFYAHLDNSRGENLLPFQFPPNTGKELTKLFSRYNMLSERIARTLRRTRQYSADVTHELRTPLTILKGETELALRNNKSKEQLLQVLSSNLEEIFRMNHLIDDLLLLSKSELGEVPLKMEALNLSSMLLELYGQTRILAEEKQIQVEIKGVDDQVSLFADGQRLRQVFLNLLSNAIKYTPEEGRIAIDCHLEGNQVQVTIEDTGIGIDSQHQEHIFDRFYRIDKTDRRNDGGSGLGLAIAKWIVDAHKGSLNVRSVPGQGSSFTVTLPLTAHTGGSATVK